MSIESEISRINQAVSNAYSAVSDMGGVVPEDKNILSLEESIRTIPTQTPLEIPLNLTRTGVQQYLIRKIGKIGDQDLFTFYWMCLTTDQAYWFDVKINLEEFDYHRAVFTKVHGYRQRSVASSSASNYQSLIGILTSAEYNNIISKESLPNSSRPYAINMDDFPYTTRDYLRLMHPYISNDVPSRYYLELTYFYPS